MMVDADVGRPEGRDGDASAFVTGIGGQDGSYLAERLLADGLEVHALALTADGPPEHCPPEVRGPPGRPDRRRPRPRAVLDVAPDEVYNLAAHQLGGPVLGRARPHRPRQRPRAPPGCSSRRWPCRRSAAARCGSSRPPAPRSSASPPPARRTSPRRSARSTRTAPPRPSPTSPSASTGSAACTPSASILYNHESPRRPAQFVTRQDHLDRRRDRPRPAPTAWSSATSTPGATGAGRPTTSTPWSGPPAPSAPTTTSSPPARATRCATSSPPPSPAPGIADWEPLLASDPALFRPADADRPRRRRHQGPPRARLGADGRLRRDRRPDGRRRPRLDAPQSEPC